MFSDLQDEYQVPWCISWIEYSQYSYAITWANTLQGTCMTAPDPHLSTAESINAMILSLLHLNWTFNNTNII